MNYLKRNCLKSKHETFIPKMYKKIKLLAKNKEIYKF